MDEFFVPINSRVDGRRLLKPNLANSILYSSRVIFKSDIEGIVFQPFILKGFLTGCLNCLMLFTIIKSSVELSIGSALEEAR